MLPGPVAACPLAAPGDEDCALGAELHATNINMENIDQFIGMEVVISNKLFDDYRLARFVNTNDF